MPGSLPTSGGKLQTVGILISSMMAESTWAYIPPQYMTCLAGMPAVATSAISNKCRVVSEDYCRLQEMVET